MVDIGLLFRPSYPASGPFRPKLIGRHCGRAVERRIKERVTLSTPRRWASSRIAFIWAVWTLFGCYSALATRYQTTMWSKPRPWGSLFFSEVSYSWISALITPGILLLADRYVPQRRGWLRAMSVHACAAIVFACLVKLSWDVVYQPPHSFFAGGISAMNIGSSIAAGLDSGFLLYWIVVIAAWAYAYHGRLQKEVLTASELRRQFASAQVEALRMQLHPHFLFNTLHTVTGLLHDDPRAAERMIARLSVFLRHSLASARTPIVPLSEELEFVRLYLEIESVRFEDRLAVEYDIEPEAEHALVPHLILQPVVENAIRYAVARRTVGGKLWIGARIKSAELQMSVRDNGSGPDAAPLAETGGGVGLANARERLKALYGLRQELALRTTDDGGSEVTISIPFENADGHAEGARAQEFKACVS